MPLNAQFFETLRTQLHSVYLAQGTVDGCNTLCTAFEGFTGHDHCTDDLAAIIATAFIETGVQLKLNVSEYGRGSGRAYGQPAGPYNKVYYGRGPCQVTWLANYARSEKRTGIPFVQFPEKMCEPDKGCVVMIDGMYNGLFTKRGLRNYITPGVLTTRAAFKAARAIINGQDKADEYADYCVGLQKALLVGYDKPLTKPVLPPTIAQPTQQPQLQQRGVFAALAYAFQRLKGSK